MTSRRFRAVLAFLIALSGIGGAGAATTFGPKLYTRTSGAPQTFTEVFPRCGGSPCQLVVVNGDASGRNRASAATIYLNGKELVGVANLNQRVDRIVLPVALQDDDEIRVVLASAPGSQLTVSVECATFADVGIDAAGSIASTVWDDGTVSLSIPLANEGNAAATNVVITGMAAGTGTYTGPTPFAYPAGTLGPDAVQALYAQFSGVGATAPFPLTISGTYGFGNSTCRFATQATVTPPAPGNGGTPKSTTTVARYTAATAVYPTGTPRPDADTATNEGEGSYRPPLGKPQYLFTLPPAARVQDRTRAFAPDDTAPAPGGGNAVAFVRNRNGGNYSSYPPDPSVAGADVSGFVMISANNSAGANDGAVSYSKDFGKTFTTVNLTKASGFVDPANPARTDFFPESDGGSCCDQVLHYVPGRNLVIWLIQYWSPALNVGGLPQKGQNRLRIAWATPQAAAADFLNAWSWFDVSPTTLGDTVATDWMDYPDLAYSNGFLYIGVDHGFWNPAKDATGTVLGQKINSDRRWMVRASLDDMVNLRSVVNLSYYEPIKGGMSKAHFVQSAPGAMYFAAQPDTSTLSVFADPDTSGVVPTPRDLPITSYCTNASTNPCDYSAVAPDNLDWNVAPHAVLGGAYVAPPTGLCPAGGCAGPTRFLYFAFDAARNAAIGRPWPYVRVVKVDADTLDRISETDIFGTDTAYATPGLVSRPGAIKDDLAFSLGTGGGTTYADNAVGFLADDVVYVTTSSNATQANSKGVARYGDYFTTRNSIGPVTTYGQGVGYSTQGYAVTRVTPAKTCAAGGCNVALRYVMFGRNEELFPSPPNQDPR